MSEQDPSLYDLALDRFPRDEYAALGWEGSLREYLGVVEQRPLVIRNAWQRLLDMVESHGCHAPERKGGWRRWKLFEDPFDGGRDAVFGLDEPLARLVRTIRAGALGYGPEKRILLLHGPVGSAKSTIARLLKRGLESYSKSDAGALYTFSWVIDGETIPSPMNQEPLLLVPEEARRALEERINRRHDRAYRLRVDGDLDPVSRYYFRVLMERHDGDWNKVMDHVRVRRLTLSEADRVGIGTFQPKDEKNQDSTELTGDVNYRLIAKYGSDSDPRAFNFDGEFNVANRGLLEFVEVLKLDVAFLYDLLGASQEHSIKPKKFAQTSIDEVIIGHTNEPEYRKLQSNELMEAFRDRTIKIDVPYNLATCDEVSIYDRQFGGDRLRSKTLAPHTLEIAALWSVMTRLEDPTHPNLTLLQKAKLYSGEEVQGFSAENVREMRAACPREGMDGISPRYVQDRIAAALVVDGDHVNPLQVLESMADGLGHHSLISNEETRKRYTQLIGTAREEYDEIVKHEVQLAVAADAEAIDRLCAKYVDNVKAYTTHELMLDDHGREREPDERLMRSIEEKAGIPDARKDDFRHEIMNYIAALHLEGKTFDFRKNQRLRRALELKLFEDQRDAVQLTSLISSVVDPNTQSRIDAIRDRLANRFGYTRDAAEEVLRYVADLFARGEAKDDPREVAA
ncbi:PrkA family serine protein kinase [Engelhardtia mirabilis]|uniref:PrkA AAA domain protein n=1 Tax=Engelhardtia mirabilis TaxID=2528011 RepID=A0A518BJA7_9BACT|nr:PrkA AAA domain protein [Planctomycetes bacterium Pla133]QDV01396.1 PrkA AAA domain protein [Planctomycetes bacterium Pla86]